MGAQGWIRALGRSRWVVFVLLVGALSACGSDGEGDGTGGQPKPYALLSAFPAEQAPLLAQATVEQTVVVNGRNFRMATLHGVHVIMGLTGIGLLNAANTTHELLDRFDVAGVIVSAVAGGNTISIGDVAVPAEWSLKDGVMFAAYEPWLSVARSLVTSVSLERCLSLPSASTQPVCMPQQPVIAIGGTGLSDDPFGNTPLACRPNGGDVYGCDVTDATSSGSAASAFRIAAAQTPVVNDMETAAIAREAAVKNLPFIAFRAASDGPGDPLNLGGFLNQFSAYYAFAARNAALTTVSFLEELH